MYKRIEAPVSFALSYRRRGVSFCLELYKNKCCLARFKLNHRFIAFKSYSSVSVTSSYCGTLKFVTFSDKTKPCIVIIACKCL
jgi:hypothetical protein